MVALTVPDSGTQDVGMGGSVRDVRLPVFTYAGAARGHNYEEWREEFCRGFCQLDAEPNGNDQIDCTIQVGRFGALSFGAARGTSGTFSRTRALLSDGCDDLTLVTATKGDILTVQRGHTVELKESHMSLLTLDDLGDSTLSDGGAFTALRIPRRELLNIAPTAEDRLALPVQVNPGLRNLVSGYFALCLKTAPSLDAVGQHTMAQHMTELVGLLMREDRGQRSPELRESAGQTRLQMIKAQVLGRLGDHDLTIVSIARRAGLTPKQVQRLFGTAGLTCSEFVLEQRLLLAHRLLTNTSGGMEKIATIAQNAGFGDLSYFNRSFRRRFGMTPSDWREAHVFPH